MHKNILLIKKRLEIALKPQILTIKDESAAHAKHAGARESNGGHYKVHIVSNKFQNQSAVIRHKMIYEALGDAMGLAIHAISIRAQTPEEATNQQAN